MKYKVRLNLAMSYILLVYLYYIIKNFNSIAFVIGVLFFIGWICISDLYYKIEKGNLIIYRLIGAKEFKVRDIIALVDPIPVLHRLNPRPGTLAIYFSDKKRLNVYPKDQVGFANAMHLANKKINVDVKSLKKLKEK